MLRIDIPVGDEDESVTEYYGASSIYSLRPVSEEIARDFAKQRDPRPVRPVEYREAERAQIADHAHDYDDEECPY